jgi:hypothetical protein
LLLNEVENPPFPRTFGVIFGIRLALVPRKLSAQVPASRIFRTCTKAGRHYARPLASTIRTGRELIDFNISGSSLKSALIKFACCSAVSAERQEGCHFSRRKINAPPFQLC